MWIPTFVGMSGVGLTHAGVTPAGMSGVFCICFPHAGIRRRAQNTEKNAAPGKKARIVPLGGVWNLREFRHLHGRKIASFGYGIVNAKRPMAGRSSRKRPPMPLIQLIVLAIVQGITEFLPVSSSAHLILAPLVADGWADQGPLIDVAAHIGSLAAVTVYFRHETGMLVRGGLDFVMRKTSADARLFALIAAATIPVLVFAGLFVALDIVDALRSPYVIAATSIFFGVLLWHGDRAPQTREGLAGDGLARVTWREAMTIGLAQMLAIIPGTSRSGVTMTAARYLGWPRDEAARFSMLLAIPTISAFGLFAGVELVADGAQATKAAAAIVAALSFVTAYATIAVFMRLTKNISFTPFVIYRIALGVLLLAFAGRLGA